MLTVPSHVPEMSESCDPSKGILGVPGLPGAEIVRAGTGGGGNMGN